jgi:tRNA-specific 2-thiouridylase
VVRIDAERHEVIVGEEEFLHCTSLLLKNLSWTMTPPDEPLRANCRIRYRHQEAPALLTPHADGSLLVTFDQPQTGVTPGQAAVFYDGDRVLGGGWIQ